MNARHDLRDAKAARDIGMEKALAHAENTHAGWKHAAYHFLVLYAKQHAEFISEDVGDAHEAAGLPQPPTRRAWGSLYRKAAREGIIVQSGIGRSRLRHATLCPRWRSLVYQHAVGKSG
jgi:photosystem II stability/assembly factor-like uncharacterized protein